MSKNRHIILWSVFLVAIASLDALRDVGRGQFEYWTYHTIKWLSFYPPLIIILYEKVFKQSKLVSLLTCFACLIAWMFWADAFRPPHWDEGGILNSQWVEIILNVLRSITDGLE